MKINAMNLEDITRYDSFATKFTEKISVIVGPNASGKTTLLDSLTFALTGQCARTDRAGRGAENMIRSGGKEGQVILEISSNGQEPLTIARKIPGGLAIAGQAGNATVLEQNLADYLGVDKQVMAAALSTSAFLDMRPSEQKAMLFELLGLSFERGDICEMIHKEIPLDAILVMLQAAPESLFDGTGSTFANLYKHFYELRRNFKRELKEMGTPPAVTLTNGLPPVEEVVEQLEVLRKESHEAANWQRDGRNAERRVYDLETEIGAVKGKLAEAGDPEAAVQQLKLVNEEIKEAELDARTLEAKFNTLNEAIKALKEAGESRECPLAPGSIKCPLTKPKRQTLVGELSDKKAALEKQAMNAKEAADFLRPRWNELNEATAVPDKVLLEANLERLETELKELKVPAIGGIDVKIQALADRIRKGEAILADIQREEGAAAERDKQQQRRQELEQTIEVLEALVEVLSPAGLPGKILSETIQPIQQHANERLSQITGGTYSLEVMLDPDFNILVTHPVTKEINVKGNLEEGFAITEKAINKTVTTPLKLLSSSERLRVGVVLQEALVHLSGLRFLIIDNLDMLDSENRALLMDALIAMAPDLDQVIALSTIGPAGVTNPHIPGLAVFKLNDGQLEAVK